MKIVKLIKDKYNHYSAIFDEIPELTYEQIGLDFVGSSVDQKGSIIASDFLKYESFKGAFAGRELKLKMKDGSVKRIKDYWYDHGHYHKHGDFISIGAETLENLQRCFVFFGYRINKDEFIKMVDDYLSHDKIYSHDEIREWCNLQYKWYDVVVHGKKIPYMMNKYGHMVERESKSRVYPRENIIRKVNDRYKHYTYFDFKYMKNGRLIRLQDDYFKVLEATLPYLEEEIRINCQIP